MAETSAALRVTGMHCSSCGMLIDDALEDLPGVRRATTKVRKRRTVVEFDDDQTSVDAMLIAIKDLGYTAAAE
jgi:copper chaperone CopZ